MTSPNRRALRACATKDNVGFDYPPRLIRQSNVFRPETVECANATVTLPPCETDPWHELAIVRMPGSVHLLTNTVMLESEVVSVTSADTGPHP